MGNLESLIKAGLIPAGARAIVAEGRKRFKLYLPMALNNVWSEFHSRGSRYWYS